jgi:GNAT superfamily N-acetyltransferase
VSVSQVNDIRIDVVSGFPPGFDALLDESRAEGLRLLSRLDEESRVESPPFLPPRGFLLAARRGDELLGICALYPDPFLDDPGVARLRHLYVAPAARRQGVGALLVEEVVRRAQGRFHRIRLRTDSPSATLFYLAAGFATTTEEGATHERSLSSDADDLGAFEQRAREADLPFEEVVKDLKRRGKL